MMELRQIPKIRRPHSVKRLLLWWLTALLVGGCLLQKEGGESLQGNADGYSGRTETGVAYLVDPLAAQCPGSGISGPTYRYSLNYYEDGLVLLKDRCSASVTPVPASQLDQLQRVVSGYQKGIYEFRSEPPGPAGNDDPFFVAWCKATDSAEGQQLGLLIKTTPITRMPTGLLYQGPTGDVTVGAPFAMTASNNGFYRTLTSPDVTVTVRMLPQDFNNDFFPGQLTVDGVVHPAFCTVFVRAWQSYQ